MLTSLVAADNKPILVGETLYGKDNTPWRVSSIHPQETHPIHAFTTDANYLRYRPCFRELKAEWLTHSERMPL